MTELFTEAIENNKSIFIALTDAQKAFVGTPQKIEPIRAPSFSVS
jgi:hypothetical protein